MLGAPRVTTATRPDCEPVTTRIVCRDPPGIPVGFCTDVSITPSHASKTVSSGIEPRVGTPKAGEVTQTPNRKRTKAMEPMTTRRLRTARVGPVSLRGNWRLSPSSPVGCRAVRSVAGNSGGLCDVPSSAGPRRTASVRLALAVRCTPCDVSRSGGPSVTMTVSTNSRQTGRV